MLECNRKALRKLCAFIIRDYKVSCPKHIISKIEELKRVKKLLDLCKESKDETLQLYDEHYDFSSKLKKISEKLLEKKINKGNLDELEIFTNCLVNVFGIDKDIISIVRNKIISTNYRNLDVVKFFNDFTYNNATPFAIDADYAANTTYLKKHAVDFLPNNIFLYLITLKQDSKYLLNQSHVKNRLLAFLTQIKNINNNSYLVKNKKNEIISNIINNINEVVDFIINNDTCCKEKFKAKLKKIINNITNYNNENNYTLANR